MKILLSLCLITLTIGIVRGGVVREDDIMDMVQAIFSNPDNYASSLGMVRVKRSNWDKEFNLQKMGFSFRIKYKDSSNKLQGGNAEIEFNDLRKLMKGVPVKSAKFVVTADAAGKFGDGLFKVNIDYVLGFLFGGQDSGKVHYERKMDGEFYTANFELMSNSENNPDRPPTVQVDLKSDYKTKATGRFFFDDHKGNPKETTWEIDFINKETFKGLFKGEKTYSFEGKFNKEEKKVELVVDIDGKKYNGFADIDFDGSQGLVKVNFDLGPAGKFDLNFNAKKDMSEAGVKLFLNDKDIFTAKLKGVLDQAPRKFKYEARYSGVAVGEGKVRVSYERFKELKILYLPKVGPTFDLKCDINEDDKSWTFHATATEDEKKTFEVKTKSNVFNDGTTIGFNSMVDWFIEGRGPFYRFFYNMNCLHCLSSFKFQSNLAMDYNKLYKFDFDITALEEDGTSHKEVYITTKDKFYALFSEHFLNEMAHLFNSYQRFYEDFEVKGEWNPGKNFKVTSNRDWFKIFLIENMDGYMRKIEFNGEELMKAGWEMNGKQIKLTVEKPCGHKMDTLVTWETDDILNNKAKMTFDGPVEQKTSLTFQWNLKDHKKSLLFVALGENELMGKFKIERNYNFSYNDDNKFNSLQLNVKAKTDIPNSLLPKNLETEIDYESSPLFANFYIVLEGEKYAFECDYKDCFRPLDKLRKKVEKFLVYDILRIPRRY